MIACVSPADYNLEETISTLRYADRARKIKNKPVIMQDPKAAEINRLNKLVRQLRLELVGQGGPIICQAELDSLKNENQAVKGKNRELTLQLSTTLNENMGLFERLMLMQGANERMHKKLCELKDEYNVTINNLNLSIEQNNTDAIKDHINKLHTMQDIFSDIDVERQKAEDEIRKHERSGSTTNIANPELSAESELSERQETHTKQQMALNSQLQEVTKMLALKEHLARQMQANNCYMVDYKAITENEEKISALEREKDELLQQLKNAQARGLGSKIAEQRRKRVQELEKEIHDLHKKLTEQARMIKLKEKDEQKIKLLNGEIQTMKTTKVKLIKNMKQESEKYRERELIKLKDQDRKRQNQMVKMETMHSRQQNVLKRKVEEAVAINKRLKDALALRKAVHERLAPWVQQELNIFLNTVDAEATLTVLLEDRAALTKQLNGLKANPALVDPAEVQQLEDEIDMQSTQIQELQLKLLDSDEENKAKTRRDAVQSMGEAKYCLKILFELTADIRRKEACNEARITELQNVQAETSRKITEQESHLKFIKASHQHELSNVAQDYEEKISVLLRQLRGIVVEGVEGDLQERWHIQQQALEQAEQELQEMKTESTNIEEHLKAENRELKKRLEEIKYEGPNRPKTPEPIKEKKKIMIPNRKTQTLPEFDLDALETSMEDDPNADPDRRKTPLARRIRIFDFFLEYDASIRIPSSLLKKNQYRF